MCVVGYEGSQKGPDTPVVHVSGSGQLRANPHLAGP